MKARKIIVLMALMTIFTYGANSDIDVQKKLMSDSGVHSGGGAKTYTVLMKNANVTDPTPPLQPTDPTPKVWSAWATETGPGPSYTYFHYQYKKRSKNKFSVYVEGRQVSSWSQWSGCSEYSQHTSIVWKGQVNPNKQYRLNASKSCKFSGPLESRVLQ